MPLPLTNRVRFSSNRHRIVSFMGVLVFGPVTVLNCGSPWIEAIVVGMFTVERRDSPKLRDDSRKLAEEVIDFGVRVVHPKTESHASPRARWRHSQGGEDVRRFDRAGRASRPARSADAHVIKHRQNRL